jgi:hypothetical protein
VLQLKRLFVVVLVGSLSLTAALAIGLLLFAEINETTGRVLATTGLLALFGLLTLPAGALFDQRRHTWLAWLVVGLAACAFTLALALVWRDWDSDPAEWFWKTLATLAAFAVASSQAAATTAVLRAADTRAIRVLYALSVVLVAVLAAMVSAAAWIEVEDETFYRILGAVAVADVLVVLLQPVLRRLTAVPAREESRAERLVFVLDGVPSADAVEEARSVLERGGARVQRVERER